MLQLIDINLVNKRLTQSGKTKNNQVLCCLYAFKTFRCYILRLINKLNKNVYNNFVVISLTLLMPAFICISIFSNKTPLKRLHQKQQSPTTKQKTHQLSNETTACEDIKKIKITISS